MTEAPRQNSVPVWYLIADDEGHGFSKKRNRDFLGAATAKFVQIFLLADEDKQK